MFIRGFVPHCLVGWILRVGLEWGGCSAKKHSGLGKFEKASGGTMVSVGVEELADLVNRVSATIK